MEGRRPRAILPSGRVSLTLIGRKLLWERKFGKFHTSRSRAVGDINKTNTTLRQAVATTAGKRWNQRLWHHCRTSWSRDTSCGYPFISGTVSAYITAFTLIEETEQEDFFKKKKKNLKGYFPEKMPADIMEKNSSSPVAATPASMNSTPDKPKTASEHRKVCSLLILNCTALISKHRTLDWEIVPEVDRHIDLFFLLRFSLQNPLWRKEEERESTKAWVSWKR